MNMLIIGVACISVGWLGMVMFPPRKELYHWSDNIAGGSEEWRDVFPTIIVFGVGVLLFAVGYWMFC